jgi:hypothetical protein
MLDARLLNIVRLLKTQGRPSRTTFRAGSAIDHARQLNP